MARVVWRARAAWLCGLSGTAELQRNGWTIAWAADKQPSVAADAKEATKREADEKVAARLHSEQRRHLY